MCGKIIAELISVAGIIVVAYLTYRYAVKKLRKETIVALDRKKYEAILEAHRNAYGLIRFITDTENEDSILVWERPKGGTTSDNIYFFRRKNIEKFLDELIAIVYKRGDGLFLSKEVLELLFEYRNIVYGLMLATRNNKEEKIEIYKKEVVTRMLQIKNDLSKAIRTNINLKNRDLLTLSE